MRPLTTKQRRFVNSYLGKANGNATEAARLAGYGSPNNQGPRLLVHASIREEITASLEDSALTAKQVLSRLSDMATADISDFVTVKNDVLTFDMDRAKRRKKSHLIKSIKSTQHGLAIELHDSQAALEKLGRYHGLFLERQQVTTSGDGSSDELERKIDSLAAAIAKGGGPVLPEPDGG